MSAKRPKRPTDAEVSILRVLWQRGPSTVREVDEALNPSRGTAHTTILKQMQVMTAKGLLVRDESVRPQVYRPAAPREQTERQLVQHLVDGAFGGSVRKLVMQALRVRDASPAEIAEIDRLLHEHKGDNDDLDQ